MRPLLLSFLLALSISCAARTHATMPVAYVARRPVPSLGYAGLRWLQGGPKTLVIENPTDENFWADITCEFTRRELEFIPARATLRFSLVLNDASCTIEYYRRGPVR